MMASNTRASQDAGLSPPKKKGGHLARPNCAQGGDLLTALVPRRIDEFVSRSWARAASRSFPPLMSPSRDTASRPVRLRPLDLVYSLSQVYQL